MSAASDFAPQVLIVEDHRGQAVDARKRLQLGGFGEVVIAPSIRSGVEKARKLLHVSKPYHPTLILLDWMLPDALSDKLEGIVIAAELVRAMDSGELHPSHIVVLTSDPTPEREQDALAVGCSLVLAKPLDEEKAQQLYVLVQNTTSPFPRTPAQKATYRWYLRFTAPTMDLLYQGKPSTALVTWDEPSIKKLLKAIVLNDLEVADLAAWVEERGGLQRVHSFLETLPIKDPDLAQFRALLFAEPYEEWGFYAERLAIARNTFFRRREQLYLLFAEALNSGAVEPVSELRGND